MMGNARERTEKANPVDMHAKLETPKKRERTRVDGVVDAKLGQR
jgi:hypothetical protein